MYIPNFLPVHPQFLSRTPLSLSLRVQNSEEDYSKFPTYPKKKSHPKIKHHDLKPQQIFSARTQKFQNQKIQQFFPSPPETRYMRKRCRKQPCFRLMKVAASKRPSPSSAPSTIPFFLPPLHRYSGAPTFVTISSTLHLRPTHVRNCKKGSVWSEILVWLVNVALILEAFRVKEKEFLLFTDGEVGDMTTAKVK